MIYNLENLYDRFLEKIEIFKSRNYKKITNIIQEYVGNDWKEFISLDNTDDKYIRNIVYKNELFEIVIITWNKNSFTKIHDHPGECVFKILIGSLLEVKYNSKYDNKCATNIYKEDNISYINNKIGRHKMYNINNDKSVSIHIYSPPIN